MALAESISRKIHKWGLIPKAIKLLPLISLFLSLASILWLFVLPIDGQYRNTYISENALMPGQIHSYFRESEWNIVRGYNNQVREMKDIPVFEKNQIIEEWLNDFGLKVSYYDYEDKRINSTLYGVMRASRGDSTEAIVLAVPWYTHEGEFNDGGIGVSIALMRYFSRMSIWSKNIILVIPENARVPLRKWVEAYHTSLDVTAGSIEAAIVVEYEGTSDYFDHYELFYEGLNGQLPNLDLINTINTIGKNENLKCAIQGVPASEIESRTYSARLKVLIKGIINLALAGLTKKTTGCEAFSGWQIQAFTLVAKKGNNANHDITQFGRLIDSTFRSVNNLLERFHQSFFFFLMLSPWNFVSIGTYLVSAILSAVSFALSALGCFLNSGVNLSNLLEVLGNVAFTTTFIYLFYISICFLAPILISNGQSSEYEISAQLLYLYTLASIIMCFLPWINKNKFKMWKLDKKTSFIFIAVALFLISLLITALLISDFAMAFCLGILTLPLTFIQPIITKDNMDLINGKKRYPKTFYGKLQQLTENRNVRITICLFLSNPVFVVYILGTYYEGPDQTIELVRSLIMSWNELQSWTWFIIILGWCPVWTMIALSCALCDFQLDEVELEIKKNQ